ncbi:MAG TPA: DUF6352 family protein [Stellaceae bacterium]|nr:DUF6352 family protein [Stellaceae bacterium]
MGDAYASMPADFWASSGVALLDRDAGGNLRLTDDFLRAYLARPEMRLVAESCDAEIALHRALLTEPRQVVDAARIAALADADARDNYRHWLRFRDRLLASPSLEACYLALFRGGSIDIPPLFIDHLAHAILRNILHGCSDPLRLRAAELLFRGQKVMLEEGAIMLADEETVEMYASTGGSGALGRPLSENETPTRSISLDVLDEARAALYWERSDRFDMVLDLSFGRPGLDAFCRVLEAWLAHLLRVAVRIEPLQAIRDERWSWHIGLDGEATAMLDDLYHGADIPEDRLRRLLALFRLSFADPALMLPEVAGRPVYLGLAMTADRRLRVKPQNLIINLPLARSA